MTTIKSYTDLNQSCKLAEILPLESADMIWANDNDVIVVPYDMAARENVLHDFIPGWSLAALFGVLPTIDDEFEPQLHRSSDKYLCTYEGKEDSSGLWRVADNPIDACVSMIEKLNELNLL